MGESEITYNDEINKSKRKRGNKNKLNGNEVKNEARTHKKHTLYTDNKREVNDNKIINNSKILRHEDEIIIIPE